MKRETVTITLSANQVYYLKRRYGARLGAKTLVKRAVSDALHEAAKQHLAELDKEQGGAE